FRAEAMPPLARLKTRTLGSVRSNDLASSNVESVDPSSTISSSKFSTVCSRTDFTLSDRNRVALYAGVMTLTAGLDADTSALATSLNNAAHVPQGTAPRVLKTPHTSRAIDRGLAFCAARCTPRARRDPSRARAR